MNDCEETLIDSVQKEMNEAIDRAIRNWWMNIFEGVTEDE